MTLTVITEHSRLIEYLKSNPSVLVKNTYSSLETDYERFSGDLNQIDVLLMVDYNDLSLQLSGISKAVLSGSAYLLKVGEIVIVTVTDPLSSPTPNCEEKFSAFIELMHENKFKVRIVKLITIDFRSIYEAIMNDTTLEGNDLKVYDKYKYQVSNLGGPAIKPIKSKSRLGLEKIDERTPLIKQDALTAETLRNKSIELPKTRDDITRTQTNMQPLENITHQLIPLVLVTGVKYSGKTTFCLKAADELSRSGFSSLVIDSTGRSDLERLIQFNKLKLPVLSGSSLFTPSSDISAAIKLAHRSPSASFITSLSHLFSGKVCIFCEIDFQFIKNYLYTYNGTKRIIVITEYDLTKMRDSVRQLEGNKEMYDVVLNMRGYGDNEERKIELVRDIFPQVRNVSMSTDMMDAVAHLEVF